MAKTTRTKAAKSSSSATAGKKAPNSWKCPKCKRSFTQVNQRHACGTGDRDQVLRDRPEAVVRLYTEVEAFAKSLGPIEIVARDRYVLLRSLRIFTDLVIMSDAVRAAIHLPRKVENPIFFKVVSDDKKVTHVAKLKTASDFKSVKGYIKQAYDFSIGRTTAK
jgi:hypothetical protein